MDPIIMEGVAGWWGERVAPFAGLEAFWLLCVHPLGALTVSGEMVMGADIFHAIRDPYCPPFLVTGGAIDCYCSG